MVEAKVKAAIVYNFTKFVAWPKEFEKSDAPIVIGICGAPELETHLQEYADKSIRSHRLQFVAITEQEELDQCSVLFVGGSSSPDTLLPRLTDLPVLTMSDQDDFLAAGGMVELFLNEGNKVRFDVDEKRARRAGMKISAKVLRLKRER